MQTEREYLVGKGLAKAGRGRFSREARAELAKARAKGIEFKEKAPTVAIVNSKPSKVVSAPEPKPEKEKVEAGEVQSGFGDAFLRYGSYDVEFEGYDSKGKRHVVSGRNACKCGYSLVGHLCDNPTSLVSGGERIAVTRIV